MEEVAITYLLDVKAAPHNVMEIEERNPHKVEFRDLNEYMPTPQTFPKAQPGKPQKIPEEKPIGRILSTAEIQHM